MSTVNTLSNVNGKLVGRFKTLKIDLPLEMIPTGKNGDQPAYEVYSGGVRIGAAWEKSTRDAGQIFYSLSIDDPSFDNPINLSAFQSQSGWDIVWRRPRQVQQEAA